MNNAAATLWKHADSGSIACIQDGQRTSYRELVGHAASIAAGLRARGIRPGDRVAVCLERGATAAAAYYGTMAAGAIVIMINDALRPRQVESTLADAEAAILITSTDVLARHPRTLTTKAQTVDIADLPRAGAPPHFAQVAAHDGAQIIYTSGSSGLPKGVLLSHDNLLANVRIVAGYLGLSPRDRTISLLPFSSVYGINQLLCSIATGGTLVVERSPLASRIVTTIKEERVTVVAAVPPLWQQLLRAPEFSQTRLPLRVLQSAGGYLPVPAVRAIRKAQPDARLFIMYGMTEIMRSTFLPPDEVDARPDCMGLPIAESEVIVVRDDDSECAPNEPGQLVHSGPTVALGYWRKPQATELTFRRHPRDPSKRAVYSGDVVRRDADGYLYFVSRSDRLIKTLGNRVGPDEITDVLLASGQVSEAAVTTLPDDVRGERIIAHVVLEQSGALPALEQFCKLEMPRWMHPARFLVHNALPRSANGKYDLHALRDASIQVDAS